MSCAKAIEALIKLMRAYLRKPALRGLDADSSATCSEVPSVCRWNDKLKLIEYSVMLGEPVLSSRSFHLP
jgi:hypothetical protein